MTVYLFIQFVTRSILVYYLILMINYDQNNVVKQKIKLLKWWFWKWHGVKSSYKQFHTSNSNLIYLLNYLSFIFLHICINVNKIIMYARNLQNRKQIATSRYSILLLFKKKSIRIYQKHFFTIVTIYNFVWKSSRRNYKFYGTPFPADGNRKRRPAKNVNAYTSIF